MTKKIDNKITSKEAIKRIKEYLTKFPDANPKEAAQKLGVERDQVYHVRTAMRKRGNDSIPKPRKSPTRKTMDWATIVKVKEICEK